MKNRSPLDETVISAMGLAVKKKVKQTKNNSMHFFLDNTKVDVLKFWRQWRPIAIGSQYQRAIANEKHSQ